MLKSEQRGAVLSDEKTKTTVVVHGTAATTAIRIQTLARALDRLNVCDDSVGVTALAQYAPIRTAIADASRNRKIRVRFITEITPENISVCRELMKLVELRHLERVKGNFVVIESEYYAFAALGRSRLPDQAIHSAVKELVYQQQYLFDILWRASSPGVERITELDKGTVRPKIEVFQNPRETQRAFIDLVRSANEEVLLFFPTPNAFRREKDLGIIDMLEEKASRGVKVRVIVPTGINGAPAAKRGGQHDHKESSKTIGRVDYRQVERSGSNATVTILVVDRSGSFVLEQRDDAKLSFVNAVGLATHSTSKANVLSHVLFFENLWNESLLREKEATAMLEEQKARTQSELLQDILTHDMRNYNQVMLLDAELLKGRGTDARANRRLVDSLLRTVRRSNELIERARWLGKITSEKNVRLSPVNLSKSLRRSAVLVRTANPQRSVEISSNVDPAVEVLADGFIDEIFINLLNNSVKYTKPYDGNSAVQVEVRLNHVGEAIVPTSLKNDGQTFWRITVADHGSGITDELKPNLFRRYLENARGVGLGMSIVHALVVDRYGGRLMVKDRVRGDHTKGAKIEMWLRAS